MDKIDRGELALALQDAIRGILDKSHPDRPRLIDNIIADVYSEEIVAELSGEEGPPLRRGPKQPS